VEIRKPSLDYFLKAGGGDITPAGRLSVTAIR
jgi:hypothetical protein